MAGVLREELEYFSIPPKEQGDSLDGTSAAKQIGTDANGLANAGLQELKKMCGNYLLDKKNIFTALQRNVVRDRALPDKVMRVLMDIGIHANANF